LLRQWIAKKEVKPDVHKMSRSIAKCLKGVSYGSSLIPHFHLSSSSSGSSRSILKNDKFQRKEIKESITGKHISIWG